MRRSVLVWGSTARASAVAVGVIKISILRTIKLLVLRICLVCAYFKAETIFLFFLALLGLDRNWQSKLMEVLFCSGNLSDGLYLVNPTVLEILNSEYC